MHKFLEVYKSNFNSQRGITKKTVRKTLSLMSAPVCLECTYNKLKQVAVIPFFKFTLEIIRLRKWILKTKKTKKNNTLYFNDKKLRRVITSYFCTNLWDLSILFARNNIKLSLLKNVERGITKDKSAFFSDLCQDLTLYRTFLTFIMFEKKRVSPFVKHYIHFSLF